MRLRVDRYEWFLVLASLIWGTSFAASKIALEHVDPFYLALTRFVIGAGVLLLVAFILGRFSLNVFRDPIVWLIGLLNAVGQFMQNYGMQSTSATNTVLLVDINVVFVALIAAVVLKESLTRYTFYGLGLGLVGVAIISTGGDVGHMLNGNFVGNLIVFLGGVVWAFYIVYQKKALIKNTDVYMISAGAITTTAIFGVPIGLLLSSSTATDLGGYLAIIYLGVACTAGAFLFYIAGLKGKGATDSSIILFLEIVFAMLFAFILLSEIPTVFTAIGGVFIIAAIMIISVQPNESKKNGKGQ
jgi:drug/metabolite transporter (DMT)-like permease